ncbi:MAG: hypothetical protein COV74_08265 [Candidatus Omnitrophica bacterium CG11_big_fil_rev_8_21_14_0_20_45_26]|uniref:Secretin/TonB short N-terminal domain-containing protein n=1 Tax=Candidatus Abzuiibacterium crystallinum TaxID=1974748 RepID=A0A2H0LP68_9BACT|nr:MAG: hypothetical protein COV74_08265 [Candidatus Omnitrophica bacterium CG11_big_fil_rev_8_21_14_0_20_45_26]PIW63655.1 MAG: hypothetical protein COW12_09150 [Candidatus Omnitrophica bacterium CG12_big_fil_rev_8_21_14_0_65_45_16]
MNLSVSHNYLTRLTALVIVLSLSLFPSQLFAAPDPAAEAPRLDVKNLGDNKISMDFSNADLSEVLKVLSTISGANFVTAEDAATRKINLSLENVTFEDALEAIVKGNALVAQKVGEENIYIIRVATGEDALIPLETRVFKLKYVRVAKPKEVTLQESSTTGSSTGSNTSSSNIGGSSSVVGNVNITGGEETEIKSTIEDLLSPRGRVTINDRMNCLVITDTSDRLDQIEKVVEALDKPLKQVLIEAIMLETALDFDRFIGTEWGTGTEGSLGSISGAQGSFNIPTPNQFGDLFNKGDLIEKDKGITFGSFDVSQVEGTLKALQTDDRTKIIAKPRMLVLDNEPAFIKITVNAVIAENTQVATGSSTPVTATSAERTEIGVTLKATPLINDNETITMTLEPRFSTLESAQFSSSFLDPRIRASRTTLAVKDGQVIVISGLTQRDDKKVLRKIPLLGDIPIFKFFFSKWTTQKLDRELIIFLRPRIISDTRMVAAQNIPDYMTSIDEEAADFWQVWDKPWFKELTKKSFFNGDHTEGVAYVEARDKAIEEALHLNTVEIEVDLPLEMPSEPVESNGTEAEDKPILAVTEKKVLHDTQQQPAVKITKLDSQSPGNMPIKIRKIVPPRANNDKSDEESVVPESEQQPSDSLPVKPA